MRVITFGFDNRALLDEEGHSQRWNTRMGKLVDRLDIIVEERERRGLPEKWLGSTVRVLPVHVPHPLLYPPLALARALREHRRVRYQLATADDAFRAGLAALAFKRLARVPFSLEYHTDTFFNREWLDERPVIHRAYERIGRAAVASADSIRCVNHKNEREIRRLADGGREPLIEVIPVPAELYDPARHDRLRAEVRARLVEREDEVVVLYVGRLAPVKKVDELVRAFAHIRERSARARLVIVGDGPERPAIERLLDEVGRERVTLTGYVAEREVLAYYGASDLFVNPAHVEPYGRVYIEAMSAGKPVVTTAGAGAVEDGLCIDGENAIVTRPGDLAALEAAIVRLVEDRALRERLGSAGERLVRDKWSYERSLERMRAFWGRTVERACR